MYEFLKFFDEYATNHPTHLEIQYSKTLDWVICIWKKGCGENGDDLVLVNESGPDVELVFAKAHVALKEWLAEYEGGY